MESVTFDDLDRRLIHALQLDGRASYSRIAAVLGVPDRTIARRYLRLRSRLIVRVVGNIDSRRIGMLDWFVRIRCLPATAEALAQTLSQRADTSWIAPLVGGTEITCMVRTPSGEDEARPSNEARPSFFDQLGRTPGVRDVLASCVLRPIVGVGGWKGRMRALDASEQVRLRPSTPLEAPEAPEAVDLARGTIVWSDGDERLARALAEDGRAALSHLRSATGWSESTVRQRITRLRDAGVLDFEVEVHPGFFGRSVEAIVWLEVAPGQLMAVTEALSRHDLVAYAAITTGQATVVAILECRDTDALYEYLATDLADVAGIGRVEISIAQRRTKRAGPVAPVASRPPRTRSDDSTKSSRPA
ncbi:Lrp/AsnC family transcriptional regulator [Embleya sp. NPDC050154]|uniref:Lrp/AsnC family transcriptional regulator n=1 Tax=unclassified Embleya TaxID=2699296 RepID=UPI0037A54952